MGRQELCAENAQKTPKLEKVKRKLLNFYRTQFGTGTGTGTFSYFWWYRKNLVPEKSLGTGIGKIEYRKKVSEPVSRKFGTEKSTGIGIENIWYRKIVSVSVSFTFWVPSHTVMHQSIVMHC